MFFKNLFNHGETNEQSEKQTIAAQKMLRNGFSVHDVSRITELSIRKVKKEKKLLEKMEKKKMYSHIG